MFGPCWPVSLPVPQGRLAVACRAPVARLSPSSSPHAPFIVQRARARRRRLPPPRWPAAGGRRDHDPDGPGPLATGRPQLAADGVRHPRRVYQVSVCLGCLLLAELSCLLVCLLARALLAGLLACSLLAALRALAAHLPSFLPRPTPSSFPAGWSSRTSRAPGRAVSVPLVLVLWAAGGVCLQAQASRAELRRPRRPSCSLTSPSTLPAPSADVNYLPDTQPADWERCYWGGNVERLQVRGGMLSCACAA